MQIPAKLKWQCRRGTQELDNLLLSYLERNYANAPLSEQQHFQQLLDLEDSELLQLLFSNNPSGLMTASPPKDWQSYSNQPDLNYLVEKIRHSAGF